MKNKRIGLALSGGGARGIAHIAFLKVLDELEIKPAVIAGTSIGAIIGTLYASGLTGKEIEDLFCGITIKDMTKMFGLSFKRGRGLLKIERASALLKKILKYGDIEELPIRMKIVATDYRNRKEFVFEKGSINKSLQASCAIPGIIIPVVEEDKILIDGGIVDPLPYELLRRDCDIIIAIDISERAPFRAAGTAVPNLFELHFSAFQIMQKALIENKLKKSMPDIYIKPSLGYFNILEFYKAKKILAEAEKDAEEFGKKLKRLL